MLTNYVMPSIPDAQAPSSADLLFWEFYWALSVELTVTPRRLLDVDGSVVILDNRVRVL